MYFFIFAIIFASVTAVPYTTEPMVLSCTTGPPALECYQKFGTTCDADCNIINPAPMNIANGSCSDRTCACVDINALSGTDESGLAISTYSSTRTTTETSLRVGKATATAKKNTAVVTGTAPTTGHCHHHHPNGTEPNTTNSRVTRHHALNSTMTIHLFKINTTATATHDRSTILVTGAMFEERNTSCTTPY